MESTEVKVRCKWSGFARPLEDARTASCDRCREAAREYDEQQKIKMILPADSASRKMIPMTTGVLDYFPLAIAGVARISKKGNDKHNPGQPLHWSRDKSTDHADCIPRHLVDRDAIDPDSGEPHYLSLAWRALAYAQVMEEKRLGLPPSRGSR